MIGRAFLLGNTFDNGLLNESTLLASAPGPAASKGTRTGLMERAFGFPGSLVSRMFSHVTACRQQLSIVVSPEAMVMDMNEKAT